MKMKFRNSLPQSAELKLKRYQGTSGKGGYKMDPRKSLRKRLDQRVNPNTICSPPEQITFLDNARV